MLSKCFAVIIPLLSCQLTLIHTQSTYAKKAVLSFLMHMPAIMYTHIRMSLCSVYLYIM